MQPAVKVKVCGITSLDDALAAVDAGAAALGFNFYAGSRRFVAPAVAASIIGKLPRSVCAVGVFVNAPRESVVHIAAQAGLSALQFHGDEDAEYCRAWALKVIKAIRVRDRTAGAAASAYGVDFILADAYVEGRFGGTGQRISAELLGGFDRERLIVAGGLTADNVADVVRSVRPFGVDVAGGVEAAAGRKDWASMKRFIANARAA